MHCYESVDGLPLAAVTVRRFKLLLKRIWVKVMFYNVLSHMHYFQASSVLHWFLVKCLIASWMQYNSVLSANMVYISKWYTALTGRIRSSIQIWEGSENWAPTGCTEGGWRGWGRRLQLGAILPRRGECHERVWRVVDSCLSPALSAAIQLERGLLLLASPRRAGGLLAGWEVAEGWPDPLPPSNANRLCVAISLDVSQWFSRIGLSVPICLSVRIYFLSA